MLNRREYMKLMAAAGVTLMLRPTWTWAEGQTMEMIRRAIPATGEKLPAVGLGSSATFSQVARSEDISALRDVLKSLIVNGGTVFDTAPGYGASEQVAGDLAHELGYSDTIFWATKLNVASYGGGRADTAVARKQLAASFSRIRKPVIDLIQVHNLGDIPTQLPLLKEIKQEGKIRYLGVTTTFPRQYEELVSIMRNEPLDFVGIDYAIDNLTMEETVLPLAMERGIAVMVYQPFGRTRLWDRVRGLEVPEWASEFDARTWAQFFLKFVLAHPAVTVVTPATSRPHHMADNMGAALGRLPDEATRRRMLDHMAALPG
jgi:aryl-alcohol dehydrogenase-like predicted oxidoreductase